MRKLLQICLTWFLTELKTLIRLHFYYTTIKSIIFILFSLMIQCGATIASFQAFYRCYNTGDCKIIVCKSLYYFFPNTYVKRLPNLYLRKWWPSSLLEEKNTKILIENITNLGQLSFIFLSIKFNKDIKTNSYLLLYILGNTFWGVFFNTFSLIEW